MSTPSSTYAINLEDGTSGNAEAAAAALEGLESQLNRDVRALREMNKALRNLNKGSVVSISAAKELRDKIKAKEEAIAGAQQKLIDLGAGFTKTAPKARQLAKDTGLSADELSKLPGPIGEIATGFQKLRSLVAGNPIAAGIAVLIAATVAFTAATVAAVAALTRYGIAQSDAARSELLRLEGLTTLRNYYGQAAGSASELQSAIDDVSESTGAGRARLEGYTRQLYRMGLRGENLRQALEGMTITADVQGERFARRFAGMAAGVARTGGEVRGLADDVRARLGGIAARRMLSLSAQSQRLRQSFERLTGSLELEDMLQGLNRLTVLFSQNTVTGRALRSLFQGLVQPIVNGITAAAPLAEAFFQKMVLGAIEVGIFVFRARNAIRAAFGNRTLFAGLDRLGVAATAGQIAVGALAGAAVAAGLVITALGVALAAAAASAAIMAAPFIAGGAAIYGLIGAGVAAVDWLSNVDWTGIGRNLVQGLVGGIRSAASSVGEAVRGVAGTATGALRDALGIRSPSRVFASLGLEIPRGLGRGVDQGQGAVEEAVGRMVTIPADVEAPQAGGRSSRSISISIGDIYVQGGGSPEETGQNLRAEIEAVLESFALELGAA